MKLRNIILVGLVMLISNAVPSLTAAQQAASNFNIEVYVPDGRVIQSFAGPNGWQGHVTENRKGVRVIFWEDPTGIVVVGKLLDGSGRDLNQLAEEHYGANTISLSVVSRLPVTSEQLAAGADEATAAHMGVYSELSSLPSENYTTIGDGKAQMYVFYDYECPYCKHLKDYLADNAVGIQSHWLPVAIINQSSPVYGAAVLDGQIPIARLGDKSGEYPTPSLKAFEAVTQNTQLLKALQTRASTPTIVMKLANGEIKTLRGFSENAPDAIQAMIRESQT